MRGSATLQQAAAAAAAADSLARPASAMVRSHSMSTASRREPHIRRAVVRHTSAQPVQQEETPPPPRRGAPDHAERSQVSAARLAVGEGGAGCAQERDRGRSLRSFQSHHSAHLGPSYASSLSRASSVRESRAATEERSAVALSPSLFRHSSFNDRSSYREAFVSEIFRSLPSPPVENDRNPIYYSAETE